MEGLKSQYNAIPGLYERNHGGIPGSGEPEKGSFEGIISVALSRVRAKDGSHTELGALGKGDEFGMT